jgi:SAM-dependent methyltransferase
MITDPTKRSSSRVENYVRYRPSYPPAVLSLLREACGLNDWSVIADVGSGTGILSSLLLSSGATVYGIEPNDEMRSAGEAALAGLAGFHSVAATAEATGLPSSSIDIVTAGQAFHWFEPVATRQEFRRILRPEGWVVLVWNERSAAGNPFLDGYEAALQKYSDEYQIVNHRNVTPESLTSFFREGDPQLAIFPNSQSFDLDGLIGRALSSSYAPDTGHPNHEPMLWALRELFMSQEVGGRVEFLYDTQVYYGRV